MKTNKTELTQAELQAYQDIAAAARRLKKAQQRARARRRKPVNDQPQRVGELLPDLMNDIAERGDAK